MTKEDEIADLKVRIKLGNQKLNEAWSTICKIDHSSQKWNDEMERWHQANEKLSQLCYQLIGLGFEDCLYIDGKGVKVKTCLPAQGLSCRVCPSKYRYWEDELMELPSPGTKES